MRSNSRGDLYVTVNIEVPKRLNALKRAYTGAGEYLQNPSREEAFDKMKDAFGV